MGSHRTRDVRDLDLLCDGRSEALLSCGFTALHYVQLLSATAPLGYEVTARSFRSGAGTGAPALWLRSAGIRGHAGARAPAHDHASDRRSFGGHEGRQGALHAAAAQERAIHRSNVAEAVL